MIEKMEHNVTGKKVVVGKIYAKWCGHCIALEPEWDSMKETLGIVDTETTSKQNTKFILEEIEESEKDEKIKFVNDTYLTNSTIKLSSQYGYPTIFKIKNGILTYYNGPRKQTNLVNFFDKKTKKNKSVRFSKNVKKHVFNNQKANVPFGVIKPNNQGIVDSISTHKNRLGYLGGMMNWIRGGKTRKIKPKK